MVSGLYGVCIWRSGNRGYSSKQIGSLQLATWKSSCDTSNGKVFSEALCNSQVARNFTSTISTYEWDWMNWIDCFFLTERKFFSGFFKIGFGTSYWITWITGGRAVQLISTDRCCPKIQPHPLPNQSTIVRGIQASLFNSWPSWVKIDISLFRCWQEKWKHYSLWHSCSAYRIWLPSISNL